MSGRGAGHAEAKHCRVVALVSLFLCSAVFDTTLAYCGDGIREAGEQCDDGNTVIGDGCSAACSCEQDPCAFVASASAVNLASVISGLLPGDTLTLQGGTYAARGSCGWIITAVHGADPRPITIRGAPSGAPVTVIHFQFFILGWARGGGRRDRDPPPLYGHTFHKCSSQR